MPRPPLQAPPFARALLLCSLLLAPTFSGCDSPPRDHWHQSLEGALTVCPDGPTVDGIDISFWQGDIDWNAVKSDGIEFAFIRAAYGITKEDSKFAQNWPAAKQAGVLRGAYQFYRPGQSATAQAEFFLDIVGPLEPGDLPPVIDVEWDTFDDNEYTPEQWSTGIATWIQIVEAELGVKPIIYTGPNFWKLVDTDAFADYPLWVANWGTNCPSLPDAWDDWVFWQTSATGSIDGISGDVDTNLFNGSLDALVKFAAGSAPPPPASPCPIAPSGVTVIEEDGPCAQWTEGSAASAFHSAAGEGGHAWWLEADAPHPAVNDGVEWLLEFAAAGTYDVWSYVPAGLGTLTSTAVYTVYTGSSAQEVVVDQSAYSDQWAYLGPFDFSADGGASVRLGDTFVMATDQGSVVAIDGLQFAPSPPCVCDQAGAVETQPCAEDGEQFKTCDGCEWSGWSECLPMQGEPDAIPDDDADSAEPTAEPESGDWEPEAQGTAPSSTEPADEPAFGSSEAVFVPVSALPQSASPVTGPSPSAQPANTSESGCATSAPQTRTWPFVLLLLLALLRPGQRAGELH